MGTRWRNVQLEIAFELHRQRTAFGLIPPGVIVEVGRRYVLQGAVMKFDLQNPAIGLRTGIIDRRNTIGTNRDHVTADRDCDRCIRVIGDSELYPEFASY